MKVLILIAMLFFSVSSLADMFNCYVGHAGYYGHSQDKNLEAAANMAESFCLDAAKEEDLLTSNHCSRKSCSRVVNWSDAKYSCTTPFLSEQNDVAKFGYGKTIMDAKGQLASLCIVHSKDDADYLKCYSDLINFSSCKRK